MLTSSDITGGSGLDDTYQRDLENTSAALEAGVTSLAPGTAIGVIDTWYGTLKNAERDDLHAIANLLAELKDELQSDRLDGPAIGSLLLRLGEQTTSAAADADDARLSPKLERLGTLLSRAGTTLGAEPVEAHQQNVLDGPASAPVSQTEKGLAPDPDERDS
ncbi:MAG: hypothetical protein ABJF88_13085 [Rhodothermales bacterium]